MAGNKIGGQRAAETNKKVHGSDFYQRIGAMGGKKFNPDAPGFAYAKANGLDWRKEAGRRGGAISRRTKKVIA